MKKEIEIKVRLTGRWENWFQKLSERFEQVDQSRQVDVYFTSQHRDFIKPEECLRIRVSDGVSELTWKPPTSSEMRIDQQFWKEELNIPFGGAPENLERLLTCIDMVKYVTVDKTRTTFRVDDETTVVLDLVADVGAFLEIETFSSDIDRGRIKNKILANDLGVELNTVVLKPYRDLVAEALGIAT